MKKGISLMGLLVLCSLAACKKDQHTPPPIPHPPTDVQLDPTGPHSAKVTWTPGDLPQERFVIERSSNGGDYAELGEVTGTSYQFVDDGISPATTYVYKVSAASTTGSSPAVSSSAYQHPYIDACSSAPPAPEAPLATFYDMPVSGLNYHRDGTYAITDSNGAFASNQTSDVSFSIGYIHIGRLKAGDNPGLNTVAENFGANSDAGRIVVNQVRLLMLLDEDADASNGIQLPCALSLASGEIDPTAEYDAFAQQETVLQLANGASLPTPDEAQAAYKQSLYHDYVGHYNLTWHALVSGLLPIEATIPFDINANGDITNTGESVAVATLDPHDHFRLKLVDYAPLALFGTLTTYKLEIHANIHPDLTIEGDVVIKALLGDTNGTVTGSIAP